MNNEQNRRIYILLGAPGAGKGTLAAMISQKAALTHIASGDLFREALSNETELGIEAKTYMEKGQLVPDKITISMILQRIVAPDCAKGLILDGFPRTIEQAQVLDKALSEKGESVSKALYIKVSAEEVVKRLSERLVCRKCQTPYHKTNIPPKTDGICDICGGQLYQRPDDSETIVKDRLKVYSNQTKPVTEYYKKADKLVEIDGEGKVEKVAEMLMSAIT